MWGKGGSKAMDSGGLVGRWTGHSTKNPQPVTLTPATGVTISCREKQCPEEWVRAWGVEGKMWGRDCWRLVGLHPLFFLSLPHRAPVGPWPSGVSPAGVGEALCVPGPWWLRRKRGSAQLLPSFIAHNLARLVLLLVKTTPVPI